MRELKPVTENVWEAVDWLQVPGLRMNHRMTVVRLDGGGLLVHSPIAFSPDLAEAIKALGAVKWFVAPSRFHDLYWPAWFAAFKECRFVASPGLKEERPELGFDAVIHEGNLLWDGEIVAIPVRGMPKVDEYVLLHPGSRSLILADLVFNIDAEAQNIFGKLFLRVNGIYRKAGISRIFRGFIKDRSAFKQSLQQIQSHAFDRMIIGHGRNLGGNWELAKIVACAGFPNEAGRNI